MSSTDRDYIRNILRDAQYRDKDKTLRDILEVIGHYQGLRPTTEQFVFNNGQAKNLLALVGTIPINYKGSYYHIPVMIWILDTHPYNAPMVFVKPTVNMRVKVSRHVDYTGKVYLPYLHDWKYNTSDLMSLVQVLICTFQEQPPVYAVSANPQPPPPPVVNSNVPYPMQSYSTPYPPMPNMPMPAVQSPPAAAVDQSQTFNVRPSLISATEEKLKRRLEDIYCATEIEKKTGEQLKAGTSKLESMMRRITDEKSSLQSSVDLLTSEITQVDEKIEKLESEEKVALIDDAIQAPTPLYRQIVNTFAEEAAYEDTIYYISEAFRSGKMDLETFQKQIRALARKQFMLRALLIRCREKAGLAGGGEVGSPRRY